MEVFLEVLREGAPPALAGAPLDRTSAALPVFVGSSMAQSKWLALDGGAQALVSVRIVEELDSADTFLHPDMLDEATDDPTAKRLEPTSVRAHIARSAAG